MTETTEQAITDAIWESRKRMFFKKAKKYSTPVKQSILGEDGWYRHGTVQFKFFDDLKIIKAFATIGEHKFTSPNALRAEGKSDAHLGPDGRFKKRKLKLDEHQRKKAAGIAHSLDSICDLAEDCGIPIPDYYGQIHGLSNQRQKRRFYGRMQAWKWEATEQARRRFVPYMFKGEG